MQCRFFAPEEIVLEIEKHLDLISRKNKLTIEQNKKVLNSILAEVMLVPINFFSKKINKAEKIIGKIDENDIPYISLALSFSNAGIWTEDKHFEKQNKIKIWKTKDLIKRKR